MGKQNFATIRELIEEIERLKRAAGDDWEELLDYPIIIKIDGKHMNLQLTAITGSYIPAGLQAVIQNCD